MKRVCESRGVVKRLVMIAWRVTRVYCYAFTRPRVKTVWYSGICEVKKVAIEEKEKRWGKVEVEKVNKATSSVSRDRRCRLRFLRWTGDAHDSLCTWPNWSYPRIWPPASIVNLSESVWVNEGVMAKGSLSKNVRVSSENCNLYQCSGLGWRDSVS